MIGKHKYRQTYLQSQIDFPVRPADWDLEMLFRICGFGLIFALALSILPGCSPQHHRDATDRRAYQVISEKQNEALGKSSEFEVRTAEDQLRQKLLQSQDLPTSGQASLGSRFLDPIKKWPKDDYLGDISDLDSDSDSELTSTNLLQDIRMEPDPDAIIFTLQDALGVAAENSRDYQNNKEQVFRDALALDLERDEFRSTFSGAFSGSYQQDRSPQLNGAEPNESVGGSTSLGVLQRFKNGAQVSFQLGFEAIRLLEPNAFTSDSVFGDASVSIPLMRGSGRQIVMEPLTQAERNMIYSIYQFERFKRTFAVEIAASYLSVLQRQNQVQNAAENYRGLITSSRRARRLLDAGRLPATQVDQAIQDELSARNRWVSARQEADRALDSFKIQLGLPTDAKIQLNPGEFDNLSQSVAYLIEDADSVEYGEDVPSADAPVELEEPSDEHAGRFEIPTDKAVLLALENRLDLRVALGRVYDAQRKIVVAADGLRAELTFFGTAGLRGNSLSDLDPDNGRYEALLNLDLPLERTREQVVYRSQYLNLEQAVRGLQELEDRIKFEIANQLRSLLEARESLRIQALSVSLAQRRVKGANLNLQAGRIQIRDLLEAQEDLLSAQNSFTAAKVNLRVAELELQRDLGVLEINEQGMWKEFQPETI